MNNMQLIDFCDKANGNIGYEILHFPDGQPHLIIGDLDHKHPIKINVRITNPEELFLLMQALDICNRHGMTPLVNIWYLMGARMDRVMSFSEPFTLRMIINMLNQYDADFTVHEPHNNAFNYGPKWRTRLPMFDGFYDIVCFPDEGAKNRYSKSVVHKDYIFCKKVRDCKTGKLSSFELETNGIEIEGKTVLVVDDLCDGGGTFCGIAPLVRKHNPQSLLLSVYHAIQKEGLLKVAKLYDHVHITNSFKDWQNESLPDNVHVFCL